MDTNKVEQSVPELRKRSVPSFIPDILDETEKRLSAVFSSVGGPASQLTVWKRKLPKQDEKDRMISSTSDSIPNLMFIVVCSESHKSNRHNILWMSAEWDFYGFPRIFWSADIVETEDHAKLYLALGRSEKNRFSLHVYEIRDIKTIASWPIEFDAKKCKEWPGQKAPFAEIDRSIHGGCVECGDITQCSIPSIKMVKEGNMLVIQADREHKRTSPIQFTLNLESREWLTRAASGVQLRPMKGSIWHRRFQSSSKQHP